jgi:glycerol-3-phosphate cytidylyltransferase
MKDVAVIIDNLVQFHSIRQGIDDLMNKGVGVNSDEAMFSYKNRYPVIPQDERLEIVSNIKQVDEAFIVKNTDKKLAYEKVKYDFIFVGDDHKGEPKWVELEDYLASKGSKVMYLPYTTHTSSTGLREKLRNLGIDDV